MFVILLVLCFA